jgi:serine-type D-Ala-D-Ala endopeptidase (penicillin-binding protein 7)
MMFRVLAQLILATTLLQLFPADNGVVEQYATLPESTDRTVMVVQEAIATLDPALFGVEKIELSPTKIDVTSVGVLTSAVSALVMDRRTGEVLYEKNSDQARSIGSITKLMTAYVFLKGNPDLDARAAIVSDDLRYGGIQHIGLNDEVAVRNLLYASLVGSDNSATAALARLSGLPLGDFIARMNEAAAEFGMQQTSFADTTGLSSDNRAIAPDIAKMLDHVLDHEVIADATQQPSISFVGSSGRGYYIESTDELLYSYLNEDPYAIVGAKTGFLPEAGYCLGTIFSEGDRNEIIVVALGSETKQGRFQDVKSLAAWTYKVFEWPEEHL